MQAIILAAGQGTRLRPLTDDRPKCLVELVGRPLLARQLDVLHASGVDDITVIGGYRADQLAAYPIKLAINLVFDRTNMVSSLFVADDLIRDASDGDLLIVYGDIVFERRVLEAVRAAQGDLVVAVDTGWQKYWELRMDDPLDDAETLKIGTDGHLVELGRKPVSLDDIQGQYIGCIKVPSSRRQAFSEHWHALDRTAHYDGKDFDNMYMTSFIQSLIDSGWAATPAYINHGWLEVDTVEDLALYERMATEGTLGDYYKPG